jgi:hypothetical protein
MYIILRILKHLTQHPPGSQPPPAAPPLQQAKREQARHVTESHTGRYGLQGKRSALLSVPVGCIGPVSSCIAPSIQAVTTHRCCPATYAHTLLPS